MRDRFIQGLIAGVVGWAPQAAFTLTMYGFRLTKLRFLDFAGVLAYGHHPRGFWDSLLAELVVLIMQAVFGAIFALLVKVISSEYLTIKGGLWGGVSWFIIYSLVTLYRVRDLFPITPGTAAVNMVGSLIYGVAMGWSYQFLNRKYGLKN